MKLDEWIKCIDIDIDWPYLIKHRFETKTKNHCAAINPQN